MSQFALKSSEFIHSSQPPAAPSPRRGKDSEACPMCRRGAATFHFPRTVFATLGPLFRLSPAENHPDRAWHFLCDPSLTRSPAVQYGHTGDLFCAGYRSLQISQTNKFPSSHVLPNFQLNMTSNLMPSRPPRHAHAYPGNRPAAVVLGGLPTPSSSVSIYQLRVAHTIPSIGSPDTFAHTMRFISTDLFVDHTSLLKRLATETTHLSLIMCRILPSDE